METKETFKLEKDYIHKGHNMRNCVFIVDKVRSNRVVATTTVINEYGRPRKIQIQFKKEEL